MSDMWITQKGKLGGPGFLSKSETERKRLLSACVRKYGYKSCLGSIIALERSYSIKRKYGSKLQGMRVWLVNTYGSGKSPKTTRRKKSRKPTRKSVRKSPRKISRKTKKSGPKKSRVKSTRKRRY